MGCFTSAKNTGKQRPKQQKLTLPALPALPARPSLAAPPNTYYCHASPRQRPADSRPLSAAQPRHAGYSQPQLPAGYSPGQSPAPAPAPAPAPPQAGRVNHQPVLVNQHDHQSYGDGMPAVAQGYGPQLLGSTPASQDEIYSRFDNVMTLIDRGSMMGDEGHLFTYDRTSDPGLHRRHSLLSQEELVATDRSLRIGWPSRSKGQLRGRSTHTAASAASGNHFCKVELYANSKLPMNLPSLALYMPAWPILCLAAQYSLRVYDSSPPSASSFSFCSPPPHAPSSSNVASDLSRRNTHIFSAGWRTGHKALLVKSIAVGHSHTVVLSIRGTASFADWAVNIATAPASPAAFLDDPGNYCHSGFLALARNLVKPVAARLRRLLQDEPARIASYSLLLTGHSAGGAVAALLYAHMLSESAAAESELSVLTGCFKRIHCVTFGAPPVSLLPLEKPSRPELDKSLFLSFVNEGDPVARADKTYVKSLLELWASPPPQQSRPSQGHPLNDSSISSSALGAGSSRRPTKPALPPRKPTWNVPPSTLSNAGCIVVLRGGGGGGSDAQPGDRRTVGERLAEGVAAVTCREDQLRGMIWGDPVCHMMSLYAGRIETLAVEAVEAMTAG